MLTRLFTLFAVMLSVTSAQQLGAVGNTDPLAEMPEKARERVEQFYGEGVDLNEMIKDLTVFFNMYKSRYTSILPVNFRHLLMKKITQLMDS